jgi:outer membrane protein TolC
MKAAVASAKLDEESNKPSLNLYGSYLQNQIKQNTREAMLDSFAQNGRAGTLGIKFSMPINLGLTSEIRQGAVLSASAAKINYRQKLFEQENDWQNLVQNLAIYKENLALSSAIESAQKSKLENERRLLKQGRTTTYQILLFEQDYSNSQLTTIQLAYKMLALAAQQKLYDQNN